MAGAYAGDDGLSGLSSKPPNLTCPLGCHNLRHMATPGWETPWLGSELDSWNPSFPLPGYNRGVQHPFSQQASLGNLGGSSMMHSDAMCMATTAAQCLGDMINRMTRNVMGSPPRSPDMRTPTNISPVMSSTQDAMLNNPREDLITSRTSSETLASPTEMVNHMLFMKSGALGFSHSSAPSLDSPVPPTWYSATHGSYVSEYNAPATEPCSTTYMAVTPFPPERVGTAGGDSAAAPAALGAAGGGQADGVGGGGGSEGNMDMGQAGRAGATSGENTTMELARVDTSGNEGGAGKMTGGIGGTSPSGAAAATPESSEMVTMSGVTSVVTSRGLPTPTTPITPCPTPLTPGGNILGFAPPILPSSFTIPGVTNVSGVSKVKTRHKQRRASQSPVRNRNTGRNSSPDTFRNELATSRRRRKASISKRRRKRSVHGAAVGGGGGVSWRHPSQGGGGKGGNTPHQSRSIRYSHATTPGGGSSGRSVSPYPVTPMNRSPSRQPTNNSSSLGMQGSTLRLACRCSLRNSTNIRGEVGVSRRSGVGQGRAGKRSSMAINRRRLSRQRLSDPCAATAVAIAGAHYSNSTGGHIMRRNKNYRLPGMWRNNPAGPTIVSRFPNSTSQMQTRGQGGSTSRTRALTGGGGGSTVTDRSSRRGPRFASTSRLPGWDTLPVPAWPRRSNSQMDVPQEPSNREDPEQQEIVIAIDTMAKEAAVQTIITSQVTAVLSLADHGRPVTPDLEVICDGCDPIRNSAHKSTLARAVPRMLARCFSPGSISLTAGIPGSAAGSTPTSSGIPSSSERVARSRSDISVACGGSLSAAGGRISGGRQQQTRMRPWSGSDAHRLRQHLMTFCKRCDSTTVRSRLAAPQSLQDTTLVDAMAGQATRGGKGSSAPVAVKALGAIRGSASRSRSRSASAGGESVDGKSVKSGKGKKKSGEKKSGGSAVEKKKRGAEGMLAGTSAGRGDMGEGVGAGDSEPEDGALSPAECPKAQLRAFAESIGLRYSTSPIEATSEPSEDSECASAGSLEPREMDLGASPESADVSLASADSKGALPDHLLPSAGCRALRLRGDKVVLSLPCELNVSKVEVGADSAMSPGHCTATAAAAAKAAATASSNGSTSAASSPVTSAAGVAPLHGCARVPCGAHSLDVRPRDGGVELALLVSASCGALFHLQVDISQTVGIRLTELPKEASDALPLTPRAITAPGDPKIRSCPESGATINAQGPLAAAMAAAVAAAAEAAGDSPLSASPLGSPLCLGPSAHMGPLPRARLALPRPSSPPSPPRTLSRDSLSDAEQQAMERDMNEVAGGDAQWPGCESVDRTRRREGKALGAEMVVENIGGRSTLSDSSDSIATPIVPRSRERSNAAVKGTGAAVAGRGTTKTRVRHSHPHLAPPVSRHDRLTPTERKSGRVAKGKGKGSRSGQRVPSKSNERTSSERRSNMSLGPRFDSVRNIRQPILSDTKRISRNDRRSTPLRSSQPSPERRSVQGRKSSHEGRQRRRTEGSCGGSSGVAMSGSGANSPKPQSPRRSGTASPIRRGSQTRSPRRAKTEGSQQLGFPECFARLIRPVKEPKHEEEDEDCEETRTRVEGDERSMEVEVPASQVSDPSDHSDITMIAAQPNKRGRKPSPRLEVLMKHPSNQFYESSSSQTIDPSSREVNIQTERSDRLRIQSFAQLSQALDALSGRISRLKKMSLPRSLEKRPAGMSAGRGGCSSPSTPPRGPPAQNVEESGSRQKRRGGGGRKGFVSWPAAAAAAASEAEADAGKPARSPGKLAGQSLHERAGSYTLIHSSIAMQSFDPATTMQSFRRFVFQTRDEQHQVLQNIFPKHLGRGFFHVPPCFVDGKVVEEEGEENNQTENQQPLDESIINVVEEEVLEERVVQDMGIILKTEIKTSKIVVHETQERSKKKTEDHSDFSETDLDTSRISCSSLETEIISSPCRDTAQDTAQEQKDSGQFSNFSPEDNQNDCTSDTFQEHKPNLDSTHNLDSISSLPLYPATEPHRMGTGSGASQGVWDLDDSYFLSKDTLEESISVGEVESEIFPETTKSALFVDDVRRTEDPDLAKELPSREDKYFETSPTEHRSLSTPSFFTCTDPAQTNDLVRLRASNAADEETTDALAQRDDNPPSENGLTEVLPRNFVVNSSIILLSVSVWSWLNSYLGEDR